MAMKEVDMNRLGELPELASPTNSSNPEAVFGTDSNLGSFVKIGTTAGPPSEERLPSGKPLAPSPSITSSQLSRTASIVDEAHGTKEHVGHVISGPASPALTFESTDEPTTPAVPCAPSAENDIGSLDGPRFYPTPEPSERVGAIPTPPEEQPSAAFPDDRPPSFDRATVSRPESTSPSTSSALNEAAALPSAPAISGSDNAVDASHIATPPPADLTPPDTRTDSAERPMDADSAHSSPRLGPGHIVATAQEPGPSTIPNASNSFELVNKGINAPSTEPPVSNSVINREAILSSAQPSIDSHPNGLGSLSRGALAVPARGACAPLKHEANPGPDSLDAARDVTITRPVITTESKITTPTPSKVPASTQLVVSNAEIGRETSSSYGPPPPPYQAASAPGSQGTRTASLNRGHDGGRALRRAPSSQHPHTTEPQEPEREYRRGDTSQRGVGRGLHHVAHKPSETVLYPPGGSFSDSSQARPTTSPPDAAVSTQVNGTAQGGKRTSSQFWLKFVLTCGCIRGEGHYITEEHGE